MKESIRAVGSISLVLALSSCADGRQKMLHDIEAHQQAYHKKRAEEKAAEKAEDALTEAKIRLVAEKHLRDTFQGKTLYTTVHAFDFPNALAVKIIGFDLKDVSPKRASAKLQLQVRSEAKEMPYEMYFNEEDDGTVTLKGHRFEIEDLDLLVPTDPAKAFRKNRRALKAIEERKAYVGMPVAALIASYGKPQKINSTILKGGVFDQYVYGNSNFVYVSGGKVTGEQTTSE